MASKSIPKRGRNLSAKKSPLGTDLARFWIVLGGARGAVLLIFYWFLYYFVEIDVFDVKPVPRRFGDEICSKMTPSWEPKTTPNRSKIDTEIWSNFGSIFDRFCVDLDVSGFAGGGRGVGSTVYVPYGSTEDFEEIECNIL